MLKNVEVDDSQLNRLEGIVHSMTAEERDEPKMLNKSRVKRVSKGAGTTSGEVNKLTKQFDLIQKMTKQMAGVGAMGKLKAMKELSKADPNMLPGLKGMPGLGLKGSTKTTGVKSKFKPRKKRR